MSLVVMYANQTCPFCVRAKKLLDGKGVDYQVIDVSAEPNGWGKMQARSGRNTIPQIFIGDHHVGGFDDLQAAEMSGELDELLKG